MNAIQVRGAGALVTLALFAMLAGCGEREESQTVGERLDETLGRTQQAANEVREGAREAAQDANSAVMGAGGPGQGAAREQAPTLGARVDDASITASVKTALAADKDLSAGRIDVDTRDGVVTLKGEAPHAAARARASELARQVKNVRSVDNQLAVKAG